MWWTVCSYCIVLGLLAESYRQLRSVRSLWSIAAPHLAQKGERGVTGEAADPRALVADLNEATIELRAGLAQAGVVPKSCAKAALSVGALAAIVQSAALLELVQREQQQAVWAAPVLSFVGGCVGAAGCSYIGRAAETEARRLREAWATLIRRSVRDVPT
jgi:hypothetical protein